MNFVKRFQSYKAIISAFVAIMLFVAPSIAGAEDKQIFVDGSASGEEKGTASKPYHSISKAIKNADKDTDIIVKPGVYKENITLPYGYELFGEDRDKVFIDGDDDESTVTMDDKTEIYGITIQDGRYGIKVREDSRVSITHCIIEKSEGDGIHVDSSRVDDRYLVSISDSIIRDNDRTGIYVEKSRISIDNNKIQGNGSDGVDLQKGVRAWIGHNEIKYNDGSGMKLRYDDSEIWTERNRVRGNDREGIEINAYIENGRIDIKDSYIDENDRWGIARVSRNGLSESLWNNVTLTGTINFNNNGKGNNSPVIVVH